MADVRVTWTLPTMRASGRPLSPADIQHVEIAMSADDGANYVVIDTFPPTVLGTVQTELEPGVWFFRGVVVDTRDRRSIAVFELLEILDETPPGPLGSLSVALA